MDKDLKNSTLQDAQGVIDVEVQSVKVEQKPFAQSVKSENHGYAHHQNDVQAAEIPVLNQRETKLKEKGLLILSSVGMFVVSYSLMLGAEARTNAFEMPVASISAHNTVDVMANNTKAFKESVGRMNELVQTRQALLEVQTELHKQQRGGKALSDERARAILMRAGYNPSQINEERVNELKDQYASNIEGDVDFATDIADELVQKEVEDFVHKVKLISNVGQYVYNRVQD